MKRVYEHDTPEFARAGALSDGIFAVAMTLLVAGIAIPSVPDDQLASEIYDHWDDIFAFALSFIVIGYYWLSHHAYFGLLRFVDDGMLRINLVYLGTIAFLPFPTALIGRYGEDAPIAVVLYAGSLAAASLLEVVSMRRARQVGAISPPMSDAVYRHSLRAAVTPGLVFLLSIPVAWIDSRVAMLCWLSIFAIEQVIDRLRPPDYARWLAAASRGRKGSLDEVDPALVGARDDEAQ